MQIWETREKTKIVGNDDISCCVFLGRKARNTHENALETRLWLDNHKDVQTIRLVTAHYHLPRALIEFQSALPGIVIMEHPVHPEATKPYSRGFWYIAWAEYHKAVVTWLRVKTQGSIKTLQALTGQKAETS